MAYYSSSYVGGFFGSADHNSSRRGAGSLAAEAGRFVVAVALAAGAMYVFGQEVGHNAITAACGMIALTLMALDVLPRQSADR